jgi:hypothetical protein
LLLRQEVLALSFLSASSSFQAKAALAGQQRLSSSSVSLPRLTAATPSKVWVDNAKGRNQSRAGCGPLRAHRDVVTNYHAASSRKSRSRDKQCSAPLQPATRPAAPRGGACLGRERAARRVPALPAIELQLILISRSYQAVLSRFRMAHKRPRLSHLGSAAALKSDALKFCSEALQTQNQKLLHARAHLHPAGAS